MRFSLSNLFITPFVLKVSKTFEILKVENKIRGTKMKNWHIYKNKNIFNPTKNHYVYSIRKKSC